MLARASQNVGQCLNVSGTNLSTTFQGGTAMSLEGTEEVTAEIFFTGAVSTGVTTAIFRLAVSNDGINWDPIPSTPDSTGIQASSLSISVSAGAIFRDCLRSESHREFKYTRVEAKIVGAATAGDVATANMNFSEY